MTDEVTSPASYAEWKAALEADPLNPELRPVPQFASATGWTAGEIKGASGVVLRAIHKAMRRLREVQIQAEARASRTHLESWS